MSLRLGIDIDGVLADFRRAFHAAARRCLRHDVGGGEDPKASAALADTDVRKVWSYVGQTANWWMGLQPYEAEQIARLYDLARARAWEVFFLTNRPRSAGDSVQFQTQCWLERYGFYRPAVLTVPGSRGDVANGLRLDLVIDDLVMNCVEIVSGSPAKAVLMLRDDQPAIRTHGLGRGIGVVANLADALDVFLQFEEVLPDRRGRLLRLADWFRPARSTGILPHNPREQQPLPPRD